MAVSLLITVGRKTISKALMAFNLEQVDWSSMYRFFSRTHWSPCSLFRANLANATALIEDDIIAIAWDDTLIKKTGKKFLGVSWQRDSLSPPWRVNFSWGFHFIQASILLPLYDRKESKPCRAIPFQLEKPRSIRSLEKEHLKKLTMNIKNYAKKIMRQRYF